MHIFKGENSYIPIGSFRLALLHQKRLRQVVKINIHKTKITNGRNQHMKARTLLTLTALTLFLQGATAHATDVEVHVQNLSGETIKTSQQGFPSILLPGQSESVTLNFPDTGSHVNVTYTSTSGKTCNFQGRHTMFGEYNVRREKEAIGSASCNNCGAILNVRRWSRSYDYRLGFWMTD